MKPYKPICKPKVKRSRSKLKNSLKRTRKSNCWKLKSNSLRKVLVRSLQISKKKESYLSSKMSRLFVNSMRRWGIFQRLPEWNLRRAITWKLFAKWSWIKDLILSNSSWSQWSRSRRRRGGSWNKRLHKKQATNSLSSFLWSSLTLNSLKRIMRVNRLQLRSRKLQSNWTILTGQIERQSYVYYSLRWIRVIKPQIGEIRHWVQASQEAQNNRIQS